MWIKESLIKPNRVVIRDPSKEVRANMAKWDDVHVKNRILYRVVKREVNRKMDGTWH